MRLLKSEPERKRGALRAVSRTSRRRSGQVGTAIQVNLGKRMLAQRRRPRTRGRLARDERA